jgi:hypothetical protein
MKHDTCGNFFAGTTVATIDLSDVERARRRIERSAARWGSG